MTVRKPGRPSKAVERREQILRATHAVVARHGLAAATVARIADEADLQRTLVLHYFGDRESLVRAFVADTVASYGLAMLHDDGAPLDRQLRRLLAPGAYASQDDLAVWLELVALGARDADVRGQLHDLWTRAWLPALERRLRDEVPSATPAAVRSTAYAFTCLFEGHWALHAQGLGSRTRHRQAQAAAQLLLDALRGG